METKVNTFSENLLRLMDGMSVRQLNDRIRLNGDDCTEAAIRSWLNGERLNPQADKVCVVAKALGVTPNDLLGFDTVS